MITKVQQKYKGVRRIQRRQLQPIKNTIKPFRIYVHKVKIEQRLGFIWWLKNSNVDYPIYKYIYQ